MRIGSIGVLVVRVIVIALAATALAHAQRVARIGVLSPFSSSTDEFRDTFHQRLKELGYVAGRNIHLEYRSAEGITDRLPQLASELVKLNVNVIVTTTAPGAQAAKQATATIPIIIAGVDDAVEQGFVSSLGHPGGNITGISWLNTALSAKRVELVKHSLPGVTHVAYLREAVGAATSLRATEAAARSLGLRLLVIEVRAADEIDAALSALVDERVEALIVAQGPILSAHEARVVALATKHRLPTIFAYRKAVEAGGLMSYGPNLTKLYWRAAEYADRIVKNAKPGNLPVEQPTSFELVINLRTAGVLGVNMSQAVLVGADDVIR
jgi:putative tryptophan/tyrosine transport system substrate-binding protein